ncbi:FAD-dependent oxidoreductase [Streptomyces boluensis]|uniref:FAD-binding monooxygenase n=1 Tax=Streptomyces boluensis TaxID=1775135 RepID=A0A964UIW7_9ACTN|nr:FAD-binding monooxygenase [Streptomyces boluensis]NBE49924.1 FAD-binding monooxygenase [Streptomyces boluensis]
MQQAKPAEKKGRAVVLGGSMAGLFAARVLADAYAEVLVVDRDALTGVDEPRRGVPQGRQVHGLQARGQQIIEELFPGFTQEVVDAGGIVGDMAGDIRWFLNGHRIANVHTGLTSLTVTRPFLERQVRERVSALPEVSFLEQYDVVGLEASADRSRVIGARVSRQAEGSAVEVLAADLVVDATGRGSRTPVWLEELGYAKVEEERRKIGLGYASRLYTLREHDNPYAENEISIGVVSSPSAPRGAIAARQEDDQVIVTAYGILGDHPPADPEGFDAFLRSLQVPDIYKAVQDLDPQGPPVAYRFPANQRRRYEHLDRFPDGLLVTGDGVCSFNPAYAQGMTVAALAALTLRRHVTADGPLQPLAYLKDLAREAVDGPWDLMVGGDLAFPGVEGERPPLTRLFLAYMALVQEAAIHDPEVADAFMRVFGLVDSSESLLEPGLLLRVLRSSGAADRAGITF